MSKLFSYCIPYDDGAAPNPFWEICTLVVCKPRIRAVAEVGDWIVGTGSEKLGLLTKVVFAMKVTGKMTMQEYDAYCKEHLPEKIPNWKTGHYRDKVGDCIYDFSNPDFPKLRSPSIHTKKSRELDLGGKNALLSDHFYYFGDRAEDFELPEELWPIIKKKQGHKSNFNAPYFQEFVYWISQFDRNRLYGKPAYRDWLTTKSK